MRKLNRIVKVRKGISVKDNEIGTFTFADYPDGKSEFVQSGKYSDVKRMALEHFNVSNSSNYVTIELIKFEGISNKVKEKLDKKNLVAKEEIAKIKSMLNAKFK